MSELTWEKSRIDLHGWDASEQGWHGPDELAYTLAGCRTILRKLRNAPAFWCGKLRAQAPGDPPVEFCAGVRDLGDAALATLDLDGSPGGPLEILLVVPAHRRKRLRPELAFEFVSFIRFLEGPESPGTELAIHDYVQQALEGRDDRSTLVFSIETRFVLPELRLLTAEHAERLAMSMIAWMGEKDGRDRPGTQGVMLECTPGGCSDVSSRSR